MYFHYRYIQDTAPLQMDIAPLEIQMDIARNRTYVIAFCQIINITHPTWSYI